jgi:hypothetical protein
MGLRERHAKLALPIRYEALDPPGLECCYFATYLHELTSTPGCTECTLNCLDRVSDSLAPENLTAVL